MLCDHSLFFKKYPTTLLTTFSFCRNILKSVEYKYIYREKEMLPNMIFFPASSDYLCVVYIPLKKNLKALKTATMLVGRNTQCSSCIALWIVAHRGTEHFTTTCCWNLSKCFHKTFTKSEVLPLQLLGIWIMFSTVNKGKLAQQVWGFFFTLSLGRFYRSWGKRIGTVRN